MKLTSIILASITVVLVKSYMLVSFLWVTSHNTSNKIKAIAEASTTLLKTPAIRTEISA